MDSIAGFKKFISARIGNIASPTFGSGTTQSIPSFNGFLTDMEYGVNQSFNAEDVVFIDQIGLFSNFADGLVLKDSEGTIPVKIKFTNEGSPDANNLITFRIPAMNAMFDVDIIIPRVGTGVKKVNAQVSAFTLLSSSISTAFNTQPLNIHLYLKIKHAFAMSA